MLIVYEDKLVSQDEHHVAGEHTYCWMFRQPVQTKTAAWSAWERKLPVSSRWKVTSRLIRLSVNIILQRVLAAWELDGDK